MRFCERCSTVLAGRNQTRFCSVACYQVATACPVRPCPTCGTPFKAKGMGRWGRRKYCSRACGYTRVISLVLWVLRANTHADLTLSDLAFWVQGDDGPREQIAVKEVLYRLRRHGYVVEARWVIPEHYGLARRAYRLVSEPMHDAERSRTA